MSFTKAQEQFLSSEEGIDIRQKFQRMADSGSYNTASSFTANVLRYPDNLIPFVDKHMNYLISHPLLEANKYLANVKLMTKLR